MMKSRALKAGLLLVALTLVTACFVGGTFAKYITSGTGADSARVAKWGVNVNATGNMFSTTYARDDNSFTLDSNSVVSTEKVLAPGTEGNFLSATVTGTPEVAVRVSAELKEFSINGWEVSGSEYFPVSIIVGTNTYKINGSTIENFAALKTQVETAIEAYTKDFEAGVSLTDAFDELGISWEWDFHNDAYQTDAKDTALGNLNPAPIINFGVDLTVTQID